jgi:hypothetical protein
MWIIVAKIRNFGRESGYEAKSMGHGAKSMEHGAWGQELLVVSSWLLGKGLLAEIH